MSNPRGRPRRYLTIEAFQAWVSNDFTHLIKQVSDIDHWTTIKLNFLLGFLGLILALLAIILVVK